MNWFIYRLTKESVNRRFHSNDRVRFFTEKSKDKGRGIIITPKFRRGTVLDFNSENRQYLVRDNDTNEEHAIHPRNLVPDSVHQKDISVENIEITPVLSTL